MEFGSRACFPLAHEFGARIRGKVIQLRSTDSQILVDLGDIVEICMGCSDFRLFPTKSEWNCHENVRKTSFHHVLLLFTPKTPFRELYGWHMLLKYIDGTRIVQIWRKDPKNGTFYIRKLEKSMDFGSRPRIGTQVFRC